MGRQPDYNVWAVNKATEKSADIGAAWIDEDRSISVKINPFVSIPAGGELTIKMYPTDEEFRKRRAYKWTNEIPF